MTAIKPVIRPVIGSVISSVLNAVGRFVPNFVAASQQYGTHAPWSLTGATGRVIVTTDDTSDSAYYWAASVGGEVVNGNQVIIENPVGPITEIFRDGANYANVQPQSIRYIDDSGIQNGTYLQGNGTDLYVDLGLQDRPSSIEFDFIARSSAGWNGWFVSGVSQGTLTIGQNGQSLRATSAGIADFNDATVVLVEGLAYHVKVIFSYSLTDVSLSYEVDGAPAGFGGTRALSTTPIEFNTFYRSRTTYTESVVSNFSSVSADTGLTTQYLHTTPVDQGNGTALVEQTGTSSAPDAIVRNFSPSDLVAVPNNTRNYRCDESSGDRLHDSNDSTQYFSYNFNGDSYMTIPPKSLVAGDTIEFDFVAPVGGYGSVQAVIDSVSGANRLLFEVGATGLASFDNCSATLDGVPLVDLVSAMPSDGRSHKVIVTVTAALTNVALVGANFIFGTISEFPVYNVRITAASGNSFYPMNNGLATQPDVLGDGSTDGTIVGNYQQSNWASRGDNDITLINGVQRIQIQT